MNPITAMRRWFSSPDYWTAVAVGVLAAAMVAGLLLILRGLS